MRSIGDPVHKQPGLDSAQADQHERHPGNCSNALYVVGTGPGHEKYMSGRALEVLGLVDIVVGYGTYLDLIKPVIEGKKTLATGMTKEVDRVEAAIEKALAGESCALVSGGDPGVYAMAGLVLEILAKRGISSDHTAENGLYVEVVPGIPALCAGASLLGAPLTHDFAAISLSDLLTPWALIETRLAAAASADFVMAIYNPKSKKRDWQLNRAQEIILEHRAGKTPVGIVTGAMRDNQRIRLCALQELHDADVGMQSIVFIGNSTSFIHEGMLITPRGYSKKYKI